MRTFIILILFLLGNNSLSFAQDNYETAEVNVSIFYTPLYSKNFIGVSTEFKGHLTDRFLTGLFYSMSEHRISETFGFPDTKPAIDFYELGWINQFNFLEKGRLRCNINWINGVAEYTLLNYDKSTNGAYSIKSAHRKQRVINNYYFLTEPGLDLNIRLSAKGKDIGYWLTTKAKYRFLLGNDLFDPPSELKNIYLSLGITATF